MQQYTKYIIGLVIYISYFLHHWMKYIYPQIKGGNTNFDLEIQFIVSGL